MFGLLNSIVDLATNAATVVVKPLEITVDLANALVRPVADCAKDLAEDVKKIAD